MSDTSSVYLHFEAIKEGRDGYFVEYSPPGGSELFATLQVIVVNELERQEIRKIMEHEARNWIERYKLPVMVTAYDDKEDMIRVGARDSADHLVGWRDRKKGSLQLHWQPVSNDELPDDALSTDYLKSVLVDVDYVPADELQASVRRDARAQGRNYKIALIAVIFVVAVVPAGLAVLELVSPVFGLPALVYTLCSSALKIARLLGWVEPSDSAKAKAEEQRRMRHHHYHCERNPRGFQRLVNENFERDARERVAREAEELEC